MKRKINYFLSLLTLFLVGMIGVNASVGVSSGTTVSISVESLGSEHLTCGRASSGWAAPMEFSKSDFYCANCGAYFPGCSASGCTYNVSHTYEATNNCYPFGSSAPDQEEIWSVNNGGPMRSGSCSGCVSCSSVEAPSSGIEYYLQIYTSTESSSYQAIGKVVSIEAEEEPEATLVINKTCANGATGTYSFQIENSRGTVQKTFSLACGRRYTFTYSGGIAVVREINYPDNISVSVGRSNVDYYETDIDAGGTDSVTFTNTLIEDKDKLTVNKVCDGTTGTFKFTVKNSSNTEVANKTISCTGETTTGSVTFDLDHGTYYVTETGYNTADTIVSVVKGNDQAILADEISVTLSETNKEETVTFTNKAIKGVLKLEKKCTNDIITGPFSFKITGPNSYSNTITGISCNDTRVIQGLTLGDYTVEEINLPNSFSNNLLTDMANNKKTVSLTKNNPGTLSSPISAIFTNSLATGSIKIKKVNELDIALENVKFKLYMKNGENYDEAKYSVNSYCSNQGKTGLVGEIQTDANGEIYIPCLDFGTYKIEETYNPDSSYILAPATFVTIDQLHKHEYEVKVVNSSIKIKIKKTNLDGTVLLNNAVFNIVNKETGETFSDITVLSEEDNYIPLIPGEYTFTEVLAPINYESLINSFDLKVTSSGEITLETNSNYVTLVKENNEYVLTVKNDTAKTTISKKDSTTLNELAGAKLQITKEDGTIVATFKTIDTPSRIELPAGSYILEELDSPKGYSKLTKKLQFIVNEDRTITLPEDNDSNILTVIDGTLVIYNVKEIKVPDTGKGLKIGLIIGGITIIAVGGYIIVKKKSTK